jgi:hypothetical protein
MYPEEDFNEMFSLDDYKYNGKFEGKFGFNSSS